MCKLISFFLQQTGSHCVDFEFNKFSNKKKSKSDKTINYRLQALRELKFFN